MSAAVASTDRADKVRALHDRLNPRLQRVHTTLLAQLRAGEATPVG